MSYSTFWSGALQAPGEHGQPAELPAPPVSITINCLWTAPIITSIIRCPAHLMGFFANYNFSVDGQGIMTAEVCAWVAGWNTKRAYGCRYGCKIRPHQVTHTHEWGKHTYKEDKTQSCSHIETHTKISTDVDASTRTHTNPFPTSCWRKAIYWLSAEVSSAKVNLRTCLMCSLSPSLFLPVSLALSEAERNSFTLQIQIHEQKGKMYSYHRWSYYRCRKRSNENIIHCKWHLNTYRQRKKSNIIFIIREKQSDTIIWEIEWIEKFSAGASCLCMLVIQFKVNEKSTCC